MNLAHLQHVLPVLQAFSHMGSDDMGQMSALQDYMTKNQMMPFNVQNAQAEAARNQAMAGISQQQNQSYAANEQSELQSKAADAAGMVLRGSAYFPDIAEEAAPQLLARAGINLDPNAALMRKAASMNMTPQMLQNFQQTLASRQAGQQGQ